MGVLGAFATDFAAGTVGSALEQGISRERVDIGKSLLSGAGNALSEVLYGTGELKGVKDAFLRGARTGAVMSGLENITDHVGSYGVAGERIFGKKSDRAVIPVPVDAELSLYTKSKEFNNVGNIGGVFKRFGTKFGRHGITGVHVHQPIRNVNLKTGEIRGGVFNPKKGIGVDSPKRLDIKQLYQFFFNKKYRE